MGQRDYKNHPCLITNLITKRENPSRGAIAPKNASIPCQQKRRGDCNGMYPIVKQSQKFTKIGDFCPVRGRFWAGAAKNLPIFQIYAFSDRVHLPSRIRTAIAVHGCYASGGWRGKVASIWGGWNRWIQRWSSGFEAFWDLETQCNHPRHHIEG